MKLNETIDMMCSLDYKERFKGEYFQLRIRMEGLRSMLKKYKDGTLNFKPSCSYQILQGQLDSMELYSLHLEDRAKIEKINLEG